jgi:hypothetical protein
MRRGLIWGVLGVILTLSACNLSTEPPTPTPELDVPIIRFQFPLNGSLVVEGTDVQIELLAEDPNGVGVARVALFADEMLHQEASPLVSAAVTVFTVSMNWLAEGLGRHTLSAIAYRPDGTASEPIVISLEIVPATGDAALSTP